MYILAFETSCDDTSVAIFREDILVAMQTASQIKIHLETNGVVPEVAAREHANALFEVLEKVLFDAKITLQDIRYIGVTTNPGLIPSLLTGITVASTLSQILGIPLLPIHHIEAHIFSNFLERKEEEVQFPLVCLTVSGGHTEIYHMSHMWDFKKVWGTIDDSAGEAYDKVAKMMGLGYPWGPIISKLASEYIPLWIPQSKGLNNLFPRVWLEKKELNFSFSGLKTAVKYEIEKRIQNIKEQIPNGEGEKLFENDKKEIAYEFQNAVNEVLAYKLILAWETYWVRTVMLAGGVSANDDLKEKIQTLSLQRGFRFLSPIKKIYSMDNAAMVWILTYYKIKSGNFETKNYWYNM
jgi:N6-L-threonylcarbamoyladenine synthase